MPRTALPLVSIITPAYNRASLLSETIESVLNQDYPNIEYIVLDDGSTDNTHQILEKYNNRLKWESHANMGETRTVNKGLGMSQGELVSVVNSDDPILPGLVERAVEFMESNPEVLVAYPDWVMIDGKSQPIRLVETYEYNYLKMLRWHHCFPGPGTFIRRRAFELEGMRDPRYKYVADFEFWVRLGLHGPFARIPHTLATFRVHQDSASQSQQGMYMAAEHIQMMEGFYGRPDLPLHVQRVRREAFSAAHYVAGLVSMSSDLPIARKYFLKSLTLHPWSFIKSRRRGWLLIILMSFLPENAFKFVRMARKENKGLFGIFYRKLLKGKEEAVPRVRL